MRLLFRFLIALFSPLGLFSQAAFQQHYGTPSNYDAFAALTSTADGNLLVAGTTATAGSGLYDMLFVKITPDGNTLWQKSWGSTGCDGANGIIAVSTGGYLVAGYATGPDNQQMTALRLDEDGNELWKVTAGNVYPDEAVCAAELADGRFALLGKWINPNFSVPEEQEALFFINAQGQWDSNLFALNCQPEKGCVAADDGGLFFLYQSFLTKYNGDGTAAFSQPVSHPVTGLNLATARIQPFGNGLLAISGYDPDDASPFYALYDQNGIQVEYHALEPLPDRQADGVALTPGGQVWITLNLRIPNELDELLLYDPNSAEVLLTLPAASLPYPGALRQPFTMSTGNGSLLVGGTGFSNETSNNGWLIRLDELGGLEWASRYGDEEPHDGEGGRMVVETQAGGFLIGGTKNNSGTDRDIWLINTGPDGAVNWSFTYGEEGGESIAAVAQLSDGSFVATGFKEQFIPFIFRVDANGMLIWFKTLPPGLADGTFGMTSTTNDDILIAMPYNDNGEVQAFLLKIDAQGQVLFEKKYPLGETSTYAYGIATAADGGYYLCGCADDQDADLQGFIAKTDSGGNLLWSKLYPGGQFFDCLITVNEHTNGNILANGITFDSGLSPFNVKAHSNGDLIYTNYLDLDEDASELSYFTWFSDVVEATGEHVLFGDKSFLYPSITGSKSAGAISLLHTDGSLKWENDFGRDKQGSFFGGQATTDGGFVAVGTAEFDKSLDAWLVKTAADGSVGLDQILAPPFSVNVSPNPGHDFLRLRADGLGNGRLEARLLDTQGRIVFEKNFDINNPLLETQLPTAALPGGLYFLHLRQGNKSVVVNWAKN
ncbi:MAG: T9SS type A sorting domain-containing protein [Lewinellaceae bacterium]|nr:T9SS type A sorting domain-containing protein [Saprospiraceae bacterium]MCB9339445.1 T9SS type A sorting domain-containing protein [Lewinellaceae bacterium]